MLAVLSPAKTLDYESKLATKKHTLPEFAADSAELIDTLQSFAPQDISNLMNISDQLAQLNHRRYAEWQPSFDVPAARPAILAFKGDVYMGLQAQTMSERDFTFAQKHLRILSGLHGVLRPLDRIRPYRLEMGTSLKTSRGKNLYEFWGSKVTCALNHDTEQGNHKYLINLASQEYFGVIDPAAIQARIINIHFKEHRAGKYRFLSFFAKKARGSMARYMIDHRVKSLRALKAFDYDGYAYNESLSDRDDWVFTREQSQPVASTK
jgi:cytoplasmic iron level regulating protein YaaA (DUF328/UPF0246 family)